MLRTAASKAIVIVPVAGFLILGYTMYNEVYPRPPYPYDVFPYIVIAWLVVGMALVALTPGVAARIGQGLSETEGAQLAQIERDGATAGVTATGVVTTDG